MIQLESEHLKIVNNILSKYPYQFYAFGSRVKGTARKYSDLDICYKESIPQSKSFLIKEEFKESNLPFDVDLSYWNNMNNDFHKSIEKDLIIL